jgi:hypothetical protein
MSYNDDYQAGLEARTHHAGQHTADYQRGLSEREGRPPGAGMGGALAQSMGSSVGAFGPMFLAFYIALGSVLVVVAAALFPVGGGLTLAAYTVFYFSVFEPFFTNTSWIIAMLMFVLPGTGLFIGSMMLENALAGSRRYRRLRYAWRLLCITGVAFAIAYELADGANVRAAEPDALLQYLRPPYLLAMAVGLVAAHFLSRRLDRAYAGTDKTLFDAPLKVPSFKTPTFEHDDDEVHRRLQAYRDALARYDAANRSESSEAAEIRYRIADLTKLLDDRAKRRQGIA